MQEEALRASHTFVAAYATFALFFGVTWPVLYVVTPQAFPSAARASGFGLVSATSKLGALSHPLLVALLLDSSLVAIGIAFTAAWAVATTCAATHALGAARKPQAKAKLLLHNGATSDTTGLGVGSEHA